MYLWNLLSAELRRSKYSVEREVLKGSLGDSIALEALIEKSILGVVPCAWPVVPHFANK